jgi:hypothetical protein
MSIQFPEEDKCQEPYQYFAFASRAVNYINSLLQNPNIPFRDAGRSAFKVGSAPGQRRFVSPATPSRRCTESCHCHVPRVWF